MLRLTGDPGEKVFLNQVIERSGQNLLECLQCGKCTGGCPVASKEVFGPRRLIASILAGCKDEALGDPTWLYCVSCGTCATRCPVEINVYRVATVLCEIAEREKVVPPEPGIHLFEKLFLKSVQRHGRASELKVVMGYNLRTMNPFSDMSQGIKLMRKGIISPMDLLRGGKKDETASRIFTRVDQVENERVEK